jgi:hypothetical protein
MKRSFNGAGWTGLDHGKMAEIRNLILSFWCRFLVAWFVFEIGRKFIRQMRLGAVIFLSTLWVAPPWGTGNAQDRVQPVLPKSKCETPCRNWSSWQSDPAFSFEGCMANCIPDPELTRNQRLQDELQRRANEARKKLEAR